MTEKSSASAKTQASDAGNEKGSKKTRVVKPAGSSLDPVEQIKPHNESVVVVDFGSSLSTG